MYITGEIKLPQSRNADQHQVDGSWQRLWQYVLFENRWHLCVLACTTLLAVVLRAYDLNRPMAYDESYTYLIYAAKSFRAIATDYSLPNNHIWHSLLVHLSTILCGNAPWAIRLPAFLAGVLLVPLSFLAARLLFAGSSAIFVPVLVACSQYLIDYSTNARGYSLLCLHVLIALCCLLYLRTHHSRKGWVLFSVASALGFYTVPTMLYPFFALVVWFLLTIMIGDTPLPRRAQLTALGQSVLGVGVLTVLCYLPVVLASGLHPLTRNQFVKALNINDFSHLLLPMLRETWMNWHAGIPCMLVCLLLIACVCQLLGHRHIATYRIPLLPILLLVPLIYISAQRVVAFPRTWIYLLPCYLICAGAGLEYLLTLLSRHARPWQVPAALLVLCALVPPVWNTLYHRNHDAAGIDHISYYLAARLSAGDALTARIDDAMRIAYYLRYTHHPLQRIQSDNPTLELWRQSGGNRSIQRAGASRIFMVIETADNPVAEGYLKNLQLHNPACHARDIAVFGSRRIVEVEFAGVTR